MRELTVRRPNNRTMPSLLITTAIERTRTTPPVEMHWTQPRESKFGPGFQESNQWIGIRQDNQQWIICYKWEELNVDRINVKKVQVQMPNQFHAVLKDYANAWDMTMSEVMYEAIGSYIYKHSECCGYINSLLTFRGVKTDKRVSKNCYGHPCFACKHRTACGAGLYEGSWEMNPEVQEYIDLNSPTTTSDTRV